MGGRGMEYSVIGIMAAIVHAIINHDVFRLGEEDAPPARRVYRAFLVGIMTYFVTDAFWGVFDALDLRTLLYADTVVYFAVMAFSVFLWTRYVVTYLERGDAFGRYLSYAGVAFVLFELAVLAINFFHPILFWLDEAGDYHAGVVRYFTLIVQIVMFLLTSGYTLLTVTKTTGAVRRRYLTISLFGIAMIVAITVQIFYPLMPFYSMGYLLGSCVLHAFVVESEKEERRKELEELLMREHQQKQELGSARRLAYTDSLTGIKNVHSYAEATELLDEAIRTGTSGEFALGVLDVNNLKRVNDTEGHEAGDRLIIDACKLICNHFRHSPVFRIGGDEFAVIMKGSDFQNRSTLIATFDEMAERNLESGAVVVALGVSEYDPMTDRSSSDVFKRADARMYQRKEALKSHSAAATS